MAFVQFSRVSLAFGDRDILKDVSLHLASGSRAALAGANGSGKTTLMKVIAALIPPDSGERAIQKDSRISYLPQSGIVHKGKTLRDEAETAYHAIEELLRKADEIGRVLQDARADDGKTAALLEEHHRIQEAVEASGYYRREADISMTLGGLGFSREDFDRDTGEFSGGWQMRIALAKVLLERPGILLLDEPTNYLDIEARGWLESWLKNFSGGYLLVSHDRYFLDVTVNEVYELFQGNLKRYAGNYSAYETTRRQELESLVKRYEAQQEEIARTEALIRRFRYKATKAAFAQELIKRLDKIERIEIPENLKRISISFPPPPHAGRIALSLEGLGKSYGERRIFSGLDLTLESGERLVVVGRNGAGKTSLLRIIAGADTAFEGAYRYGAGIQAGYFSQDAAETMGGSRQVLEFLESEAPTALIPRIRDMLGAFLFRGDDVHKSLSVLSGGEKSRLALLRILLKPVNLLILDEPTNHLDLQSKDILLETLASFGGTIIFVSHDRGFMEALSTKTLELASPAETAGDKADSGTAAREKAGDPRRRLQSRARLFYGNYGYYLDRLRRETAAVGATAPGTSVGGAAVVDVVAPGVAMPGDAGDDPAPDNGSAPENTGIRNSGPASETGHSLQPGLRPVILIKASGRREAEKQRQAAVRRLERREAEIVAALESLEREKTRLEAELSRPEVYTSGDQVKALRIKIKTTESGIAEKTAVWEETAKQLEKARTGEFLPGPPEV
ncbi:MAG: ABC-F family ATP-binding cassette domain-containing protein [Treponema sp.]|jgi:ATP-binding cassette subfamily F protein 3|nr:ABC-F family ATP-binding cassette domain-containing protein [Treponema sp.]